MGHTSSTAQSSAHGLLLRCVTNVDCDRAGVHVTLRNAHGIEWHACNVRTSQLDPRARKRMRANPQAFINAIVRAQWSVVNDHEIIEGRKHHIVQCAGCSVALLEVAPWCDLPAITILCRHDAHSVANAHATITWYTRPLVRAVL